MYFFVYNYIGFGGVETLLFREAKWYRKIGDVRILCHRISSEMESLFDSEKINFSVLKTWNPKTINRELQNSEVSFVKFFTFSDYVQFRLKHKVLENKVFYYCIYPEDCFYLANSKNFFKRFVNRAFAEMIKDALNNNIAFFMDRETMLSTLEFYNMADKFDETRIVHLPFEIKPRNYHHRLYDSKLNILAVARADFPFKGYLLGLVNALNSEITFIDIKTTIISFGGCIERLKQTVDNCKEQVKKNIKLVEGVSYQDLDQYYQKADLYIGMGTTILEAAAYKVPSIVVKPFTNDFISNGFFFEDAGNLGSVHHSCRDGVLDIKRVLRLLPKEYLNYQEMTYKTLVEGYDENSVLSKFNQTSNIRLPLRIKLKNRFIINAYFKIHSLLSKIKELL